MFTVASDFDGGWYNIPHSPDAPNSLSDFINQTERFILEKLFGATVYNDFITGVVVDPAAEQWVFKDDSLIEQKWKDLRDGSVYEYNNKSYRYSGINEFLKPYIYQEWIARNVKRLTPMGMKKAKVENAERADPGDEIQWAYRNFSKLVGGYYHRKDTLYGFLYTNRLSVYIGWNFDNIHVCSRNAFYFGSSRNTFGL